MSDVPAGLSADERELYQHLMNHLETEAGLLEAYHDLAGGSQAPYVSFLARLIAEDEARHHRLYQEWAEALRSMATFGEGEGVPFPTREADPELLLLRTEQLIEFEREDARELKVLEKRLKDVRDTTLWALLVEVMRLDTEKHVKILEFMRDHAKHTAKGH